MKPPIWCDRVVEGGVLFLLVFTPLAFGTVQPWSEAIAQLVILTVAVTWILNNLRNWELRIELPPGWLPGLMFLGLVVFQVIVPGWSLDAHATRREGLKLLAAAALFLVCYNTYRTRGQVRRAVWTMTVMAAAISILGVVQRVTWNGRLYWIGPETIGAPFGPFVNRTHFAGLMVIVIPAALSLAWAAADACPTRRPLSATWRDRLRDWNSRPAGPRNVVWILIVVIGAAALVSGSRGGMVAVLASLTAMVAGALGRSGRPSVRAGHVVVIAILILLAAAWIGADILYATTERLAEELERSDASLRVRLWTDGLSLWRQAPLFGTGLGTFGVAFPTVRTIAMPRVFTHAESDWFQLLTDTGAVGLALALAALLSVAFALFRGHRPPRRRWASALSLAGLVALLGTALQGVANYNVPVMSNLIYLAVVVASAGPGLVKDDQ